jgi:ABC-type Fe3+ transport system permease subunit
LFLKHDYAGTSLFISPIAAGFTIAFHTTTIIIIVRRRAVAKTDTVAGLVSVPSSRSPARTMWGIGFVCFLCVLWIAVIILTVVDSSMDNQPSYDVPVGVTGSLLEFLELFILIAFASVARLKEPSDMGLFYL